MVTWSIQHLNPDGIVNVQELSLIQNIILTGFFPDGTPVGPCGYVILPKLNGDEEATVTFYINDEGISAYLIQRLEYGERKSNLLMLVMSQAVW